MNRSRAIAIGAFTGVIILLLVVIVWVESVNSTQTVTVWLVTKDVSAGQPFTTDVVEQVQIKGQTGDFAYTTRPASTAWVFREALHKNDIVRDDDLVSSADVAQIPITAAESVDFSATGNIDVYLFNTESACVQLIKGQVPVVSGVGTSLVIQVPREDEAYWLALTNGIGDDKILIAPSGGAIPNGAQVCAADALPHLTGTSAPGPQSTPSG
jgi:hypothetical protein